MAKISNPRKGFNFSISFPQLYINPFLFQQVDLPDSEVEVVEHADSNFDVKTGGRRKIGNITLEKLLTTNRGSEGNYFWDWHDSIANAHLGGGLPPIEYWRTMIVEELAEDGVTPIARWVCENVWPHKIDGQSHARKSSDNTIEKIEMSVEKVSKIY
jgi:phage tail-like protein